MTEEEKDKMKIGLWNIRAENLRAIECSLADTQDKTGWQKEVDTIDNAFKYIEQLESDKQKLIEKLEKIKDYMLEDQYVGRYYIEDIDEILSFVKGE